MSGRHLTFIFLLTLCHNVLTLNILAIISVPLKSHYMSFHPLFQELANRGHRVTVINSYPDKNPVPNLTFIDLNRANEARPKMLTMADYEQFDASYIHLKNIYKHLVLAPIGTILECESLFRNDNVTALYANGTKFDVIFVEEFVSDCGLVYAGLLYDAPIIGIASHVMLPWKYSRMGIPFDPAADAFYFSDAGPNPPFLRKLESAILTFLLKTVGHWYMERNLHKVFSEYLPGKHINVEQIAKEKMKMYFSSQHFSLTGARLLSPQVLEIGGLHIRNPKPVTMDIERFLENATHGAVYVSFGSNLKASTMSKKKLQQFLTAFTNMPYKVLWKWENGSLPTDNKNVYTSSWFSQLDVLCHPKVKAFVSHGGMLSISEAAHCATPVLTIPFFGDQFSNAASVRSVGLGKTLFFDRLNAQNLEETVRELMSEEMQQNAQRVSRQWHDRPQSAMSSAIYWTEYVARHRSSPPSLPSKHNTWFQSMLIDVYVVLLGILLTIAFIVYFITRLIKLIIVKLFRSIFGTKTKKE